GGVLRRGRGGARAGGEEEEGQGAHGGLRTGAPGYIGDRAEGKRIVAEVPREPAPVGAPGGGDAADGGAVRRRARIAGLHAGRGPPPGRLPGPRRPAPRP